MQLSKKNIDLIKPQQDLAIPAKQLFDLPEKVLQFGTGVLLRGLPDYFIDKANRQGIFNGRIVVVKSTASGGTDAFNQQDGLYSVCVRGLEDGREINEVIINSSVSRVLSAQDEWQSILACAENPGMQVVISNTTEVGIALVEEDIHQAPPQSFPGKLLAVLYRRYTHFNGDSEKGMVIIPTELIIDNGKKLRAILTNLAVFNKLGSSFINWLQEHNHICNSLVDRIVPGKLSGDDLIQTQEKFGYTDDLMIMAESFRLWAIESDNAKVKDMLSFTRADEGAVIAADIEKFRELKLRLLNGTHSFSCGLAYLAGFTTVKQAMADERMAAFIHDLAIQEIARAVAGETISYEEACAFAGKVLDRFRNPFLEHQWLSISVQYTAKMKMRNVPLLVWYYEKTKQLPAHMILGFAAYLLFMKAARNGEGDYVGTAHGKEYKIQDDQVAVVAGKWNEGDAYTWLNKLIGDKEFWGADLSQIPGFEEAVAAKLRSLQTAGVMTALQEEIAV